MSAPVQRDDNVNDARLYAPPWARERPLPAAGQPQFTSSPPVASASNSSTERSEHKESPRLPKGVGGPNISWVPKAQPQEAFTGDVAIQALRRRLALEPEAVPHPPIVMRREAPFPWIARLGLVCLAAGIGAFCITALSVTDVYSPDLIKGEAPERFVPTAGGEITPARLVVESGRAAANDPLPLGVSLKDPTGGESVFLSGLENGTRLTAGTPLGSKGWRISARELGTVLAYAPMDYIGAMHAAINLHAANNAVVDTQVIRLEWVPKNATAPRQQQPQTQPQPQQPQAQQPQTQQPQTQQPHPQQPQQQSQPKLATATPVISRLDQEEIARLIRRAQQMLQSGDVSAARLMLRRAAAGGSGQAALMLGGTYDPEVLRESGVMGIAANPTLARDWYQKALELGAGEASRRIERLAQNRR
ncbi:MAG: hypothetical protein IT536_11090 [Hyphomicrobiales bacterium]|nr:hypothetical protein [Hyphomicrobiales bacterium]